MHQSFGRNIIIWLAYDQWRLRNLLMLATTSHMVFWRPEHMGAGPCAFGTFKIALLQTQFVYILQLAVHTLQRNWISRLGRYLMLRTGRRLQRPTLLWFSRPPAWAPGPQLRARWWPNCGAGSLHDGRRADYCGDTADGATAAGLPPHLVQCADNTLISAQIVLLKTGWIAAVFLL